MAAARVHVDGKFFRLGGRKFYPRGLTYGPFAPNEQKEMFPSREQTVRDFLQLRELGANLLRIYYVPPRWFLDLAAEHELKLLVDPATQQPDNLIWKYHWTVSKELEKRSESTLQRALKMAEEEEK